MARAGRSGTAYSLVSSDEVAYMLDLHLFLGLGVKLHVGAVNRGGGDQWPSGEGVGS